MEKMEVTEQRGATVMRIQGNIENDDGRSIVDSVRNTPSATRTWVIDLASTRFIDSQGLEALMTLAEDAGRRHRDIILSSVTPEVQEILLATRLDPLFVFTVNTEEALQSLTIGQGETI